MPPAELATTPSAPMTPPAPMLMVIWPPAELIASTPMPAEVETRPLVKMLIAPPVEALMPSLASPITDPPSGVASEVPMLIVPLPELLALMP